MVSDYLIINIIVNHNSFNIDMFVKLNLTTMIIKSSPRFFLALQENFI